MTEKPDLADLWISIEARLVRVESDLTVIKWMVGFNLAVSVAVLIKLLA